MAPVAYVLMAGVLACLMVPGTLLALGAGLLFGAAGGTAVALCSALVLGGARACCSAVTSGRDGLREIGGRWFDRIDGLLTRRGAWAVIAQRFIPGLPDGPANYVFGAGGVTVPQMAAGTLVGLACRGLSPTRRWAARRASSTRCSAAVGTAVLVLAALFGVGIASRAALAAHSRRRRQRVGSRSES